jgi:hypothetical protein
MARESTWGQDGVTSRDGQPGLTRGHKNKNNYYQSFKIQLGD